MKIIFLICKQFRQKILNNMGLDVLSYYSKIEIWDISSLLAIDLHVNYHDIINHKKLKKINSWSDFYNQLGQINKKQTLLIPLHYAGGNYQFLFDLLNKYNIDYAIKETRTVPRPIISNSIYQKNSQSIISIRKIIIYITLWLIKNFYIRKYIISNLKKRYINPKYVLVGNELSNRTALSKYNLNKTKIIKSHVDDYERYLEYLNNQSNQIIQKSKNNKSLVFLDEYLPFHDESLRIAGKMPVSIDYYREISKFLLQTLNYLNLDQAVIALHPNANKEDLAKFFTNDKFLLVQGKTMEYVADSKIVIGHESTSFNYAILCYKPIMIIKTIELMNSRFNPSINYFAKLLKRKPNLLTQNNNLSKFDFGLNETAYKSYIDKYIKFKDTPDKKQWEIFLEQIVKDYT